MSKKEVGEATVSHIDRLSSILLGKTLMFLPQHHLVNYPRFLKKESCGGLSQEELNYA